MAVPPFAALEFDPADERLPLGLRRCGAPLARAQAAIARAEPAFPFGQALLDGGARTACFHLQALARLYAGLVERERLDEVRWDVKLLEDLLGAVDVEADLLERAAVWELPVEVRALLARRHAEACGRLRGWAEARSWVPHRYMEPEEGGRLRAWKLSRKLRKVDWPNADDEPAQLARALADRLRAVHADIERLDLSDLEGGLHEARRQVRWFSIQAFALDGGVVLDAEPAVPHAFQRYATPTVVGSPYNRLPRVPEGVRPVRWPAALFYALSWLIAELGVPKDRAQRTDAVQRALQAVGRSEPASHWLRDEALSAEDACSQGQALIEQVIHADRLLLRTAEALEAQG